MQPRLIARFNNDQTMGQCCDLLHRLGRIAANYGARLVVEAGGFAMPFMVGLDDASAMIAECDAHAECGKWAVREGINLDELLQRMQVHIHGLQH